MKRIQFVELRDDWYRGADLMARLIARAATGEPMEFTGFPRQWEPVFAHFGVNCSDFIRPPYYIPIASEFSTSQIHSLVLSAQRHGRLRQLTEVFAATDVVIADVLHRLDRRLGSRGPAAETDVPLTGWQSYGRADTFTFAREVDELQPSGAVRAVALPCSRARPYARSKTHRRLARQLASLHLDRASTDLVVITSLGIVPEAMWEHPVVMHYDAGVPDIYRVLRLMRSYFARRSYEAVVDCLEFEPYSDCLHILVREGLIGRIEEGPKRRIRRLPCP